jgi:23S rRNA (adenine2503-C2)-methyltransferase
VPQLQALGEKTQAMLAISLHATNDELREQLVPLNKKYPLKDLMAAIRAYPGLGNAKRVTFEYVMLKGVNDSPAEAKALVQLLKGIPAKINLIPFNPWPGSGYECSSWSTIEAFAAILNRGGYASPIRTPARPRHPGRLRPAEEREREAARQRPSQGHALRISRVHANESPVQSGDASMPTSSRRDPGLRHRLPVFLLHAGVTVRSCSPRRRSTSC